MTTAVRTEQDCKLTYALTTTPNPLTASPPNIIPGTEDEHAFADIDIVISNTGNKPVRCSRIAVVLPVGSYARDLAVTGEGIDAYVSPETQWTIVDIQSDVLLAVPTTETAVFAPPDDTTAEPSQARFEVVPRSGREIEVDGLYIHLSGIKVSTKSGTARIGIEEWATDTEGPLPEVPNTGRLDVAKFPFRSGSDPHPGIGRALVALTGTGQPPRQRSTPVSPSSWNGTTCAATTTSCTPTANASGPPRPNSRRSPAAAAGRSPKASDATRPSPSRPAPPPRQAATSSAGTTSPSASATRPWPRLPSATPSSPKVRLRRKRRSPSGALWPPAPPSR